MRTTYPNERAGWPIVREVPPARVLHVVSGLGAGGVSKMLDQWCKLTDAREFEYEIAAVRPHGIIADNLRARGHQIHEIRPLRNVGPFRYMRQFDDLLKEGRYDIVHSHVGIVSALVFIPAILHKVRIRYLHAHTNRYNNDSGHGPRGGIMWLLRLLNCLLATDRIACSQEAARYVFPCWASTECRPRIVPNGIDLDHFRFSESARRRVRDERGAAEKFVVGAVGRLSPEKNQRHLILVFAEVLERRKESVLWLVGDGPERTRLEHLCRQAGIADSVVFIDTTTDVASELAGMDVFVMPSKAEGLGIAAIEAQAMGLPCVVSDRVPAEVNVTGRVEFVSLASGVNVWARRLLDQTPQDRHVVPRALLEQGYDIKSSTTLLNTLYHRSCERAGLRVH